jgi:hypothetical protein
VARRHDGDARARHAQAGRRARHAHHAPERLLRPQRQDRVVERAAPRARAALRDRRRQHHVGQRLPPSRGNVALHARVPEGPLLGHRDRRDRADPGAQPGRLLRLRPRQAPAHRRPRRADARGARPDRRVGARQVGPLQGRRASVAQRRGDRRMSRQSTENRGSAS